eukprot:14230699-Heterocapsa_arctica.AAC.1
MAAGSASLSMAIDRKLYASLSWQHMLYGQSLVTESWREELIVKDIVVTDAHSRPDHLSKDGSAPAERQIDSSIDTFYMEE